jgi:predicted nucleic acid-binding protein
VRRYTIDAPTLLHVVEHHVRVAEDVQLVAPNSVRSEAVELLLRDVAADRRNDAAALDLHERLTAVKIRLLGDRVSRAVAFQIAREQGWSDLHDAELLAVTRLQADALVTVDPALAAKAEGIVPVADLAVLSS